jgi:hypothetical protein
MKELRESVGTLVKNLDNLHETEYKVVFNLHENTFFQKLIPIEVLEKIRVRAIDYFKALLFLGYFSKIIANDYSVCDNLETISKAIRDVEREKGEYKGESGASYLNLETVVLEAGVWTKEKQIGSEKNIPARKAIEETKKRYKSEKQIDLNADNTRKIDCFYEGIGEMVCSQVSEKTKPFLEQSSSRADIGALVFADSILTFLRDKQYETAVYNKLANKDYLSASLIALKGLLKEASVSRIESAIKKKND